MKYQGNKYDFILSPGQTLKFKAIKDNKFSFKLINLTEFEYYDIDIENGTTEIDYYYTYDSEEKSLYNFGNYSFENDLRKYFKKIVCHEEKLAAGYRCILRPVLRGAEPRRRSGL